MANFYAQYPASAAGSSNFSVGPNGQTAPTSSTEIGFIDGSGDLQGVSPSNPLPVDIVSGITNPLPVHDAAFSDKSASSFINSPFDEVDLTYVPSGNGAGQIATATYKLAAVTVNTLTFSYNASNQLTSVVKS